MFDSLKNSHVVKFGPSVKTVTVEISGGVGDLPSDFEVESVVSSMPLISNFASASVSYQFTDYDIRGLYGAKKIHTDFATKLYVAYVP